MLLLLSFLIDPYLSAHPGNAVWNYTIQRVVKGKSGKTFFKNGCPYID